MKDQTDDFDEILKQFSSGEEFSKFLKQLQNRGIEKMLEGEFDSHLGHDKHQKNRTGNAMLPIKKPFALPLGKVR